jgi:hypothetical protein
MLQRIRELQFVVNDEEENTKCIGVILDSYASLKLYTSMVLQSISWRSSTAINTMVADKRCLEVQYGVG